MVTELLEVFLILCLQLQLHVELHEIIIFSCCQHIRNQHGLYVSPSTQKNIEPKHFLFDKTLCKHLILQWQSSRNKPARRCNKNANSNSIHNWRFWSIENGILKNIWVRKSPWPTGIQVYTFVPSIAEAQQSIISYCPFACVQQMNNRFSYRFSGPHIE